VTDNIRKDYKSWRLKEHNPALLAELVSTLPHSEELLKLLSMRGVTSKVDVESFLNPSLDKLSPPFDSMAFQKASELIVSALKSNHQITIYGDYDVDGTCSTFIIYDFLRNLGAKVNYFVPSRFSDGYGLNITSLKEIIGKGTKLIVTVDCGISSVKEVEYAKSLGCKVIVTDHHRISEDAVPPADAILHPEKEDCCFSYYTFAGVGVAYYFLIVLRRYLAVNELVSHNDLKTKLNLKKYLDLVSLATVADVVPLNGENRTLVKEGLKVMEHTYFKGLHYLKALSGVEGEVSAFDIGFKIAPRINAAGRMNTALRVIELFDTEDDNKALEVARVLHHENAKRKEIQGGIMENISETVEADLGKYNKSIVLYSEKWHEGIIGICASKLVETYSVPSLLLVDDNKSSEPVIKGSGRSMKKIDLYKALTHIDEEHGIFMKYGGHKAAAGFSLLKRDFDKFVEAFNKYLEENTTEEDYIPTVDVDMELSFSAIDTDFVTELQKMEPYGEGNSKPLFMTRNLVIERGKVLKDKHFKAQFVDPKTGIGFDGICFNMAKKFKNKNSLVAILYTLEFNTFNGRSTIQLVVKDVQ
jgi:single-stranded-DNA-specific exonuclease